MGKTTLALEGMNDERIAQRYRARRWFVRCEGVMTRTEFAVAIARTIGLPITSNTESTVHYALAKAPAALLLDNMETPNEEDRADVEQFLSTLASIPGLALIATMRGHTRPRVVTWAMTIEPKGLSPAIAAKVFFAAAGRTFPEDRFLYDLLEALDGVPLAITLMGHFAEKFPSLELVWERWEEKRTGGTF